MPKQRNSLDPFLPDDFVVLLDARPIRTDHHTRGSIAGHQGRQGIDCQECCVMAVWGLAAAAAVARGQGWTRDRGLQELHASSARVTTTAKEGARKDRADQNLLAKPLEAAHGVSYRNALTKAHVEERLEIPPAIATRVLGLAIRALQDQTARVEPGQMLPWGELERALGWAELQDERTVPKGFTVAHAFDQIVAACEPGTRAGRLLDDHALSKSANAARQTVGLVKGADDGPDEGPIERASEDDHLGALPEGDEVNTWTCAVARRLIRRSTLDPVVADHVAHQVIRDFTGLGSDRTDEINQLCDLIAKEAIHLAREDMMLDEAAANLSKLRCRSPENTRAALADAIERWDAAPPLDRSDPDHSTKYAQWLDACADAVLQRSLRR